MLVTHTSPSWLVILIRKDPFRSSLRTFPHLFLEDRPSSRTSFVYTRPRRRNARKGEVTPVYSVLECTSPTLHLLTNYLPVLLFNDCIRPTSLPKYSFWPVSILTRLFIYLEHLTRIMYWDLKLEIREFLPSCIINLPSSVSPLHNRSSLTFPSLVTLSLSRVHILLLLD